MLSFTLAINDCLSFSSIYYLQTFAFRHKHVGAVNIRVSVQGCGYDIIMLQSSKLSLNTIIMTENWKIYDSRLQKAMTPGCDFVVYKY